MARPNARTRALLRVRKTEAAAMVAGVDYTPSSMSQSHIYESPLESLGGKYKILGRAIRATVSYPKFRVVDMPHMANDQADAFAKADDECYAAMANQTAVENGLTPILHKVPRETLLHQRELTSGHVGHVRGMLRSSKQAVAVKFDNAKDRDEAWTKIKG